MTVKRREISFTSKWRGFRITRVRNSEVRLYLNLPHFRSVRECGEACTINGVHFPKGIMVTFLIYSLHRDPEYWPDPEKFDPERYEQNFYALVISIVPWLPIRVVHFFENVCFSSRCFEWPEKVWVEVVGSIVSFDFLFLTADRYRLIFSA